MAEAVAGGLGNEERAELLPQDKQRIVREVQGEGPVVAKVGGTDVALETADAGCSAGACRT